MSLLTNWGYTISDADALPDMLTAEEFSDLTAGKYAGDARIAPNISAACSAVRNYCGWHVYPAQECEFAEYLLNGNGRIKIVGRDLLVQLPAAYVSAVSSVRIGEDEVTDYALETNGILHIFDVPMLSRKSKLTVEYTAGVADGMMAGIKELISNRVTHALASSAGIQSETAGGVSVTYSASWINSARASALADDNKDALTPYRVQGVF